MRSDVKCKQGVDVECGQGAAFINSAAGRMNLINIITSFTFLVLYLVWFVLVGDRTTQYVIYVTTYILIWSFITFLMRLNGCDTQCRGGRGSCCTGNPHVNFMVVNAIYSVVILGGAVWLTVKYVLYKEDVDLVCEEERCNLLLATLVFGYICSFGCFITVFANYKDYKKSR